MHGELLIHHPEVDDTIKSADLGVPRRYSKSDDIREARMDTKTIIWVGVAVLFIVVFAISFRYTAPNQYGIYVDRWTGKTCLLSSCSRGWRLEIAPPGGGRGAN